MLGQSSQNLEKNVGLGANNLMLAYSPQDLFYSSTNIQKNTESCAIYDLNNIQQDNACSTSTNIDPNSGNHDGGYSCFSRELCKNMNYAKTLDTLNASHDKSNKGFTDTNTQYNLETINMTNLIIGICGTFLIMYYV
jgi:hypothetical protein